MREKMITRTIYTTTYTVMTVSVDTREVTDISITVPSADTIKPEKLEATIQALLPVGQKFVTITGQDVTEQLYGMSESVFIQNAKLLPPRTKAETD